MALHDVRKNWGRHMPMGLQLLKKLVAKMSITLRLTGIKHALGSDTVLKVKRFPADFLGLQETIGERS